MDNKTSEIQNDKENQISPVICFKYNTRTKLLTRVDGKNGVFLEVLNNSKKQIQLNLCIQVNIVLQNSHFDCGDITTAQNIKNSPLESASEMSDEENIFNT